jgi:hypothetical protein
MGSRFAKGDRVRLAASDHIRRSDAVGTVVEWVDYALRDGSSLRDVLVRWDTGLEVPIAPANLELLTSETRVSTTPQTQQAGPSPSPSY